MKESNQLTLTYNQTSGKICLETYDEGFFNQSIDITSEVVELVVTVSLKVRNFQTITKY